MSSEDPPPGCNLYQDPQDVPSSARKYWQQRYDIFSRYDEGVWMTDDAWFGVTPEPIAETIASQIAEKAPPEKTTIIDAFAGVGGNTIAFARSDRWERVFAIEKDANALQCAKHNAKLYGVEKKIWFIQGDCFDVMKKRLKSVGKDAVIFASPPWGGPGYMGDEIFNLSTMQPYNLYTLYESFSKVSKDMVLYLPRTSNLNQLARLANDDERLTIIHYCMWGAGKALCVFYGRLNHEELNGNSN